MGILKKNTPADRVWSGEHDPEVKIGLVQLFEVITAKFALPKKQLKWDFKNDFCKILIADLDSSQKSMLWKWLPFFLFKFSSVSWWKVMSKLQNHLFTEK